MDSDGQSVTQLVNGGVTFFCSDFDSVGNIVGGDAVVLSPRGFIDDDYFGFAIGFQEGPVTASQDFLLVDWKRLDQPNFISSDCPPTEFAKIGLAVTRLRGTNSRIRCTEPRGVEEARGSTLGSVGWEFNKDYNFRFVFTEDLFEVYVDGVLEASITSDQAGGGPFSDGKFCFYNYSQENVKYSAFEKTH